MKKILLLIGFLILFICGVLFYNYSIKSTTIEYGNGNIHTEKIQTQYIKSKIDSLSREKFNNMCDSDSIPSDLSYWYKSSWKDTETKEDYTSWIYINGQNKTYKLTLKIENNIDTTFILEARTLYDIR